MNANDCLSFARFPRSDTDWHRINLSDITSSRGACDPLCTQYASVPRADLNFLNFASGKEIASQLGISRHTVKTHKVNIYAKLGISKNTELVVYALEQGIVSLES